MQIIVVLAAKRRQRADRADTYNQYINLIKIRWGVVHNARLLENSIPDPEISVALR
jgi:hypothetical protein